MTIFNRHPPTTQTLVNKTENFSTTSNGTITTTRVINKHNFTHIPNVAAYIENLIYMSGESYFQQFTDYTSDPAIIDNNWKNIDNKYVLLPKDAIIAQSGNITQQATDSFLTPSGFVFSSGLSNALKTRELASGLGLYDTPVFNPYIHYIPNDSGIFKIDYSSNFKAATKYLDPYSDYYIFQTSISSGTFSGNIDTDVDEAP